MFRTAQTTVFMLFVLVSEAYAQSAAPGSATDIAQDDRGIAPWAWIIIGVVIVGGVIWAYRGRRSRS